MRVLIASDHYPPSIGGAQLTTWFLAQQLARRGHEVAVATVWQPGLPTTEVGEVPVYRLRQLRTAVPPLVRRDGRYHQPPFPDPITVFALRRLVRRYRPDVVHSHGWFSYSCAAALFGTDIPLVLSARDYGYACANRTMLRGREICSGPELLKCIRCSSSYYGRSKGWLATLGVLMSRPLLRRRVRGLHSVSAYVEQRIAPFVHNENEPIVKRVIHEFIPSDPSRATPDEIETHLSRLPSTPFILFVGALRPVKGVEELFSAYVELDSPPPLALIGTREPDTPRDIPMGITVLTDFPHAAVMEAWRRCMFAVLPSLWPEPFGMVLVEAMSSGTAVITTVPGGHGDVVIDGVTGLLIPPGNSEALRAAMRRLIDDRALRERLAENAYERASRITPDRFLSEFEDLYESVRKPAA